MDLTAITRVDVRHRACVAEGAFEVAPDAKSHMHRTDHLLFGGRGSGGAYDVAVDGENAPRFDVAVGGASPFGDIEPSARNCVLGFDTCAKECWQDVDT